MYAPSNVDQGPQICGNKVTILVQIIIHVNIYYIIMFIKVNDNCTVFYIFIAVVVYL